MGDFGADPIGVSMKRSVGFLAAERMGSRAGCPFKESGISSSRLSDKYTAGQFALDDESAQ